MPRLYPGGGNLQLSVIIPTMNEEEAIGQVIDSVHQALQGWDFEILVVDTNSKDRTREIAAEKGAVVIDEPRHGYGRAYKTGFERSKGDVIATLDADCTYPAEEIPALHKTLMDQDLEFFTTNRFAQLEEGAMTAKHRLGNFALTFTSNLFFGVKIKDSQSGMWVFRRGILDRFGLPEEKVLVTPLGLSRAFRAATDPERERALRRELDLPGPFLLFVGASEPRKNLPRLVQAMAILRGRGRRVPLVLAGRPGGDQARLAEAIAKAGLEGLVRLAGYRSDEDIRALYGAATALVFPSLAEGFGLPLLEAMACGLPAAVSGVSALPEVGGDAALYFDPADAAAMAAAIASLLDDESLRLSLRAKGLRRAAGFDWAVTARLTLDFYRRIAGSA